MDATGASADMQMATMRAPRILGEQLAEAVVAINDLSAANRELGDPVVAGRHASPSGSDSPASRSR